MCVLTECTSTMFCIWPDDGSMSRNMSPKFYILLPIYFVFIDWINYYIISKHYGLAPVKTGRFFFLAVVMFYEDFKIILLKNSARDNKINFFPRLVSFLFLFVFVFSSVMLRAQQCARSPNYSLNLREKSARCIALAQREVCA